MCVGKQIQGLQGPSGEGWWGEIGGGTAVGHKGKDCKGSSMAITRKWVISIGQGICGKFN